VANTHEGSICAQCGELIGEPRRDEPAQWKPKCGSTSRTFPVHTDATAQGEHGLAVDADATVQVQLAAYYPQMLLTLARRFMTRDQIIKARQALVLLATDTKAHRGKRP
jgi:hypothetical protein